MSQDEVLRCLMNLGGSAWIDQLADEYNRIHFPRNTNYTQLNKNETKKTMQTDSAKLLRDGLISRVYKYPPKRDPNKQYRKYGFYQITEYGYHYIRLYNIDKQLDIKK